LRQGLIFIEPQHDDEVEVRPGISYAGENGYDEPGYNDTIIKVVGRMVELEKG